MEDQTKSFQHYVPRFLLEYFSESGKLQVYDRDKKEFRSQSPNTTTGEKSYYVFTDKKGKKNDSLEKMFSVIEGTASSVIRKLVNEDKLDLQDKAELALFISALYLRVPESLKRSDDMATKMTKEIMSRSARFDKHFNYVMDQIEKKHGKKIDQKMRKGIQKTFINKEYDMKFPKGYIFTTMLKNLEEIYRIMVQMEWLIIKPPNRKSFICSDHPAYTFNSRPEGFYGSGIGILALNCETVAILTPKIAVYLKQNRKPDAIRFVLGNSELIDSLNFRTAITSSRFVISQNEPLLRKWVRKTQLDERGPYSAVSVG